MYAIAVIRYRKPLEEVLKAVEEHRDYLRMLKQAGILVASGPFDPRYGGAALFRVPDEGADAAVLALRDEDPYVKQGLAQWEVWPWRPNIGKEELDRL
jgi:uncharacterized protein YciI